MSFRVAEECLQLGLRAGAIVFRGVRVTPTNPALRDEIAQVAQVVRARFAGLEAIRATPEVIAFCNILRKVGVNPRKEQPSIERLISFVLKRSELPAINNLVDVYNLVSIRSLFSMGAHDLDTIACPVSLRLLTGNESFTALGKEMPTLMTAGEFGYVDAQDRVLCRLDLLQADFSKVTEATSNVLLIIEGTTAHSPALLRQTFTDAIELLTRYCGGTAEIIAFPTDLGVPAS
jgi:DNA/RNA-binding domain of Phe-tRNA-synthetase-like protein